MLEDLNKEKLAKENLEEKVKELEKVVSEYPDSMREATTETVHKAIEEFKATEVKELEDKASDIASSTIIFNIFCEHPDFDFSILGEDMVELVQSWKEGAELERGDVQDWRGRREPFHMKCFLFFKQCGICPLSVWTTFFFLINIIFPYMLLQNNEKKQQ
ncbi:hypothetical protein PanWU01x14_366440 [Parasponia andersonii]|uniref:Uncharacterized protein n=1 Tax=Parasponia andersonii TaxID=3476 RepID=A0A2P5A5L9_PARAD|nr:hypothetical protein PanWU01x14_366440 [Parasponia andersonii]